MKQDNRVYNLNEITRPGPQSRALYFSRTTLTLVSGTYTLQLELYGWPNKRHYGIWTNVIVLRWGFISLIKSCTAVILITYRL